MKTNTFLPYAILLVSISSIMSWCSLPIGNTFLWWFLDSIILYYFYKEKKTNYNIITVNLFLVYCIISFLYGALLKTEYYWDWKLLVQNLMTFMLPLTVYAFCHPKQLSKILLFWFNYAWLILIILTPFLSSDAFGRFLVPYSFLALFAVLLDRKSIFFIIAAYIITCTLGNESRSDIIKFTFCILLGSSFLIPKTRKLIFEYRRSIIYLFWTLPIILFVFAAVGKFNIFRLEEELGLEGKYNISNSLSGKEVSVLTDTRTLLYIEEISSAINNNYVLQGRSIARGYDSAYFGDAIDNPLNIKRGERGSCEVSILNIFNYFGLIGVVIYFLIFASASYKAVTQSQNLFVPIIGIYVAFRWAFGWIEDFSRFDLNYLFLWIMIGICFSPFYRNMSNKDIKHWLYQSTKH
jgi:hypothetical protein